MTDNCIYDCEEFFLEHVSEVLRKARKPHNCCECGDTIAVGDTYEQTKGRGEGGWEAYKTCARCVNVRNDFFVSWIYGMMVEAYQEEHGFDYRDGIPADFTPCGREEPGAA